MMWLLRRWHLTVPVLDRGNQGERDFSTVDQFLLHPVSRLTSEVTNNVRKRSRFANPIDLKKMLGTKFGAHQKVLVCL